MALKKSLVLLSLGALVACTENNIEAMNATSYDSISSNDLSNSANNGPVQYVFPNKKQTMRILNNELPFNMKKNFNNENGLENNIGLLRPKFFKNNFNGNKENNDLNRGLLQNSGSGIFQNVPYSFDQTFAPANQNKQNINNLLDSNNNKFKKPAQNNGGYFDFSQQPNNLFDNNNVQGPGYNNNPMYLYQKRQSGQFNQNIMPEVNNGFGLPFTFDHQQQNYPQLQDNLQENNKPTSGFYLNELDDELQGNEGLFYNQGTNGKFYSLPQKELINVEIIDSDDVGSIMLHNIWQELAKYDTKKFNEYMSSFKNNNNIDISTIMNDLDDLLRDMPSLRNKRYALLQFLASCLKNDFDIDSDDLINNSDEEQYRDFDLQNVRLSADSRVISKLIDCVIDKNKIEQFNGSDFKNLLDALDNKNNSSYQDNTVIAMLLYNLINKLSQVKEYYNILKENIDNINSDNITNIKKDLLLSILMKRASELSSMVENNLVANNNKIYSDLVNFILEITSSYSGTQLNANENDNIKGAKDILINKVASILHTVGKQLNSKETLMTGAKTPMANILLNWHLFCKFNNRLLKSKDNNSHEIYPTMLKHMIMHKGIINVMKNTIGAWSEINGTDHVVDYLRRIPEGTKALNIFNMLNVFNNQIIKKEYHDEAVKNIQMIKHYFDPEDEHDFINDLIVLSSSDDQLQSFKLYKYIVYYLYRNGFGKRENTTLYHENITKIPNATGFNGLQTIINDIIKGENQHINIAQWDKFYLNNCDWYFKRPQLNNKQILPQLKHKYKIMTIMHEVLRDRQQRTNEPRFYVFGEKECREMLRQVVGYAVSQTDADIPNIIMEPINDFITLAPKQMVRDVLVWQTNQLLNEKNTNNVIPLLVYFNKSMQTINKNYITNQSIAKQVIRKISDDYDLSQDIEGKLMNAVDSTFRNLQQELLLNYAQDLNLNNNNNNVERVCHNIAAYYLNFMSYSFIDPLQASIQKILKDTDLDIADLNIKNKIRNKLFGKNQLAKLHFINGNQNTSSGAFMSVRNYKLGEQQLVNNIIKSDPLLLKYLQQIVLRGLANYSEIINAGINRVSNNYENTIRNIIEKSNLSLSDSDDNVTNHKSYAKNVYDCVFKALKTEFPNSQNQLLTTLKQKENTIVEVLDKSLKAFDKKKNSSLSQNLSSSLYYAYNLFQVILSRKNNQNALLSPNELHLTSEKTKFTNAVLSNKLQTIARKYKLTQGINKMDSVLKVIIIRYSTSQLDAIDGKNNQSNSNTLYSDFSRDSIINVIDSLSE